MDGRLVDKVAVITGAASGIGRGIAERFVAEGACVVLCDLPPVSRAELASSLGEMKASLHYDRSPGCAADGNELADRLGSRARFVAGDVSERETLEVVIARAVEDFGGLDILVDNAAVGHLGGTILECPDEVFNRTIEVNLRSVWLGIKLAIPHLTLRGGGSILSTSSTLAVAGTPGAGAYSASKAAVLGLTRAAAQELASASIRVNCICPGGIVTPSTLGEVTDSPRDPEMLRRLLGALHPIPRAGEVADVVGAALWLASDEASFVTGQAIVVDGGLTTEYDARLRHGPDGLAASVPDS